MKLPYALALVPLLARGEIPAELRADYRHAIAGGTATLTRFVETHELSGEDKLAALQSLEWHIVNRRDSTGAGETLRALLAGDPPGAVLREALRALYLAKLAASPVAEAQDLLEDIAARANSDGDTHRLLRAARSAYGIAEPARSAPIAFGIVRAGSEYADEAGPHTVTREVGTASVVETAGKKGRFVLTAAHLLAGKNPSLKIGSKTFFLAKGDLLLDNDHDLALAKLPPVNVPSAFLRAEDGRILAAPELQAHLDSGDAHFEQVFYTHHDKANEFLEMAAKLKVDSVDDAFVGLRTEEFLTYRAPWARPAKAVELGGDFARQQAPELVDGGGELHANYGSSPGMSGTFLLRSERGGTPELKGVLSQYNRYFRDSYFVSAAPVEKLADEFAAGKRGAMSPTRWRFRNGLTYRDFGKGITEANFLRAPSGDGVHGDGGDGVHGDGGDIFPGNPDSALRRLSDLQCRRILEESRGDFSLGFLALVQRALAQKYSPSPARLFRQLGIHPGILWNGVPTIGIRVTPKNGQGPTFLLYANPEAIHFLREHRHQFEFMPVHEGEDLQRFAAEKIRRAFGSAAILPGKGDRLALKGTTPFVEQGGLELGPGGISLKVVPDPTEETHATYDVRGRLIDGAPPAKFVPLELDAKGRVVGERTFFPVVEIQDKGGRAYDVDLRRLYFTDLSEVAQSLIPGDGLPTTFDEALRVDGQTIQISVRNVATGRENATTFVPRDCSLDPSDDNWLAAGKYSRSACKEASR